jgi:hypothetical protein
MKYLDEVHKCNTEYSKKPILYILNISCIVIDGVSKIGVQQQVLSSSAKGMPGNLPFPVKTPPFQYGVKLILCTF